MNNTYLVPYYISLDNNKKSLFEIYNSVDYYTKILDDVTKIHDFHANNGYLFDIVRKGNSFFVKSLENKNLTVYEPELTDSKEIENINEFELQNKQFIVFHKTPTLLSAYQIVIQN